MTTLERGIGAALLACAVACATLGAQSAPAPMREFTLLNGMRVTLVHVGTERRALASLVLHTGEVDEPAFGPGLAALTASILLEGTVARSARRVQVEAESLGTRLSVQSGPVSTTVSGDVPTARIPRFLSLVADLVRHPLLDTAGFTRVRRNALATLDSVMHNPEDLARQQWRAIVFPNGPFGRPYSYVSTLRGLQLGHVRNVYDDNYSASRAHLYVSGVFDDAATERSVRDIFSDWKAGLASKVSVVRPVTVHELVTLDEPGSDRSFTWIGLPTIDPADRDFAKLEVTDMLVAGGDSSRVALELARIEGTAPRGTSTIWQRRGASYWVDELDVRTANTGAAIGSLIGTLATLKRNAPAEAEVARARNRVVAAFRERKNSRAGMVALLELMSEHSLGEGWLSGYVERVMSVTAEDVRTMVATHLDPERMAIAVVGDRVAIEPQLASLRPSIP